MTWFGNYEVLYEIRSGGMGKVLLARRSGPGGFEKLVAIKTIRTDLAAAAPQMRAMFLDEAAILARLSHPAIATVHDFGEIDGAPEEVPLGGALYLVMEYVAGVPLHHLAGIGIPPLIAAQIIAGACRGIHAAHELRDLNGQLLGVVHRDISPDNVLIDFDGHVKVIDFGIALVKGRRAAITEMGVLKGKPPYMSPEQLRNEAIDRRSDIYSFGVVAWELLTGRPLFGGDSIYAIARAIEDQPIVAPSTIAGSLPFGLDGVVLRALARDPALRYSSAIEVAEQLEHIVAVHGGESLESYCARALVEERESHRQWLANILGAGQPAPRGRATGATTAVAETIEVNPGVDSAVSLEPVPHRSSVRRLGSIAASVVAAAAVLAVLGWQLIARPGPTRRAAETPFALISRDSEHMEAPRRGELPPVSVDAQSVPVAPEVKTRPVLRGGSGRSSVDARSISRRRNVTIAPDEVAPSPAPVVGTGYLKVTSNPFAYVSINGGSAMSTPILKAALPAGTHRVVLTDPSSGDPILERTVMITADQLTTVSFP